MVYYGAAVAGRVRGDGRVSGRSTLTSTFADGEGGRVREHETDGASYALPSQVLRSDVDGQMVLLDLASETYFGLDEVGARMVARLTELPFDEAVASLIASFDADPALVRRDLDDLVERLVSAGLLIRVGG
jgi:hypothetical protein